MASATFLVAIEENTMSFQVRKEEDGTRAKYREILRSCKAPLLFGDCAPRQEFGSLNFYFSQTNQHTAQCRHGAGYLIQVLSIQLQTAAKQRIKELLKKSPTQPVLLAPQSGAYIGGAHTF